MRRDDGSQHILEVTVVLCVAFAVTTTLTPFLTQDAAHLYADRILEQKAADILAGWRDTPFALDSCSPLTSLDAMMAGDGSRQLWQKQVSKHFGAAYDADLVIENMHGVLPVQGSGRVLGTTAIVHWTPELTNLHPTSRLSTASGTETIQFDVAPVRESSLQRVRGDAIRYNVHFVAELERDYSRSQWAVTALPETTFANGSVWWEDDEGDEILTMAVASTTGMTDEVRFRLRAAAPNGSDGSLEIVLPRGWSSAAWDTAPAGWTHGVGTLNGTLWAVRTTAHASFTTFTFSATPPSSPARSFDIITARLSGPSRAESSLVVTYPLPDADRGTPRVLASTTPYPVARGQDALFGVAFANGGDEVVVTRVDIEVPGGYDLKFNDGLGACTGFSDGLAPDQASKSREKPRF
jgi:hypothetical protein